MLKICDEQNTKLQTQTAPASLIFFSSVCPRASQSTGTRKYGGNGKAAPRHLQGAGLTSAFQSSGDIHVFPADPLLGKRKRREVNLRSNTCQVSLTTPKHSLHLSLLEPRGLRSKRTPRLY